MLKLMGKKIFTILSSKNLFSKPVLEDFQDCHCGSQLTPTKRSDAQPLVKYEKKTIVLGREYKSGNVMQKPRDSYVCGIITSSESIPIISYILYLLFT